MKNIVASGFFLVTLFLAVEEKVTGLKGFKTKPSRMMARSVLFVFNIIGRAIHSDRALDVLIELVETALHATRE
jgi:hypothetical protein